MTVSEFRDKYNLYMDIPLNRWVSKENMTDKEKSEVSGWDTMGGYLKTLEFKEACRIWWSENPSQHERFLTLPGFDAAIFEEITGIDVKQVNDKMTEAILVKDGKNYRVKIIEEIK